MRIALMALAVLLTPVGLAAEMPQDRAVEVEATPKLVLIDEAPSCSVSPAGELAPGAEAAALPQGGWDPATCGACGHHCSSDNLCFGLLLGDFCNNNGGICRAFDGCALFNCCRCSNG